MEGVKEKKAARIIKFRETREVVTEENLAAEIQLPIETIQGTGKQIVVSEDSDVAANLQEDSGLPVDQTTISSEIRLSRLETIILQLGQSVQTIAEEMKSLKDSTRARSYTVQEFQQTI